MYHTGDAPEQLVDTVRDVLASQPGAIAPTVLVSNERRMHTQSVVGDTKPLHDAQERACLEQFRESFDVATIPLEDQHEYYHNAQVDLWNLVWPIARGGGVNPSSQVTDELADR